MLLALKFKVFSKNYIEVMRDQNTMLSSKFVNSWHKGQVAIRSVKFFVTLEIIGKAIGIACEGVKVERKGSVDYIKFGDNFFEGTKELIRVK